MSAPQQSVPLEIRYRFDLPDGTQSTLDFAFDAVDFRLLNEAPAEAPFWTELGFNQCANCPLSLLETTRCPAALHMTSAVVQLKALVSFDTVGVTVEQPERTTHAQMAAQSALSSVLGLIMATSGCPWSKCSLDFLLKRVKQHRIVRLNIRSEPGYNSAVTAY